MNIQGKSVLRNVAPTLSTTAYSAGDLIGIEKAYAVKDFFGNQGGTGILISAQCVELKNTPNKAAIDVLVFSAQPTIAVADNAQLQITDADMTNLFLGRLSFSSYGANTTINADATLVNQGLLVCARPGSRDLWVVFQSQGTPTYAANDLIFKFGCLQD